MLTRRNFIKTITTLGMGMVLPSVRPGEALALPASRANIAPIDSASPVATATRYSEGEYSSLIELERCADLLDDLDCTEIVTKYVGLTEFSRCAGDANFWRAYCPFCDTTKSLQP